MLTLLSPAKKLLHFNEPFVKECSTPLFLDKARDLMQILKSKSQSDIAKLMNLSSSLAQLNYERYQAFNTSGANIESSYPALYFFQGDVYQTLHPLDWSSEVVTFSQSNLLILSGLYGLLRPLDRIQPYRLEMGTRLRNLAGANLYDFWQQTLASSLNDLLSEHKTPVIINLASAEYFKAINTSVCAIPIIHIQFLEEKNKQQKVIGIYAKKARGLMARFIMQHRLENPEAIKDFNESGYRFDAKQSSSQQLTFVRKH